METRKVPVRLKVDGRVVAEGAPFDERCNPVWVLASAASNLARRGIGLKAGDLVSTGSHTPPLAVAMGADVVAEFEGLGEVRVRLDA